MRKTCLIQRESFDGAFFLPRIASPRTTPPPLPRRPAVVYIDVLHRQKYGFLIGFRIGVASRNSASVSRDREWLFYAPLLAKSRGVSGRATLRERFIIYWGWLHTPYSWMIVRTLTCLCFQYFGIRGYRFFVSSFCHAFFVA